MFFENFVVDNSKKLRHILLNCFEKRVVHGEQKNITSTHVVSAYPLGLLGQIDKKGKSQRVCYTKRHIV